MKEGLEKYFESGQAPEDVPTPEVTVNEADLPTQGEEAHAEINVQQEENVEQVYKEVGDQAEVSQEEVDKVLEEDVVEIGDAPVQEAPQLETVEEPTPAPIANMPEGVEKLVEFMNETGGTLQDYLNLNREYGENDSYSVLREYYTQTKPHLDNEDIEYLISKRLDIDEDLDENEARERKITLKEDLAKAKNHLKSNKERYYNDLKASKPEAKQDDKLIARQQAASKHFITETDKVFEGFKGFNFSLGEGKPAVRYRVDDADKLKETQSDLNNVIGGFLDEDGKIKDAYAYHKALFAMQNADKMAQLFYEQGKADAIKEKATDSKNIDFSPQLAAPSSKSKLQPGQVREIESPKQGYGVNLKYTKF